MRPGTPLLSDLRLCLGFFTTLPGINAGPAGEPGSLAGFSRAVRMLPVAGGVAGALAAAVLAGASLLGLPASLAAALAICVLVALSGAMHEDGLADCADGFFGGASRARKLEIMQDSQIGTFGAAALVLSLYLRAASLALIAAESQALAAAVLVGGAAVSRTVALLPLVLLPPAKASGAGFAAGQPARGALAMAGCLAVLLGLAPAFAGANPLRLCTGIALAAGAAYLVAALAKSHIGGQTGDVAGAAQQLSEIVFYLVYAARP